VDQFVAISRTVQRRIQKIYRRDASIIYPPIAIRRDEAPQAPGDYFLIVSRLIPYKRIDLAVEAFNRLGLPLRIIGTGRDGPMLWAMARDNVHFEGFVGSDAAVRDAMARCRALIFPGEEDFGLTPLEAMSAGRPVIAYAAGGALDTVVEGLTGVFFREPTPEALMEAVRRFEGMAFDAPTLQAHAARFNPARFQQELDQALHEAVARVRA
jgi:glycosyltransferase involved in cell wall biosynthesis